MKTEIAERLPASRAGYAPEIIVHDLARVDKYPELDDRAWGISPWFKVEGKGLYHRGVEVFLAIEEVAVAGSVARPIRGDTQTGTKMFVVGRIPFDSIVTVDWDGDEYYRMPHFYCWFDQADGPYEEVVLYEERYGDYLSLRDDLEYKPQKRSRLRQWKDHRQLRKAQRDFERAALEAS